MTEPHIHAEAMMLYAQDAAETDKPWERWERLTCSSNRWVPLDAHPIWYQDSDYRRKPKTININGFEIPEPMRKPLEYAQIYFVPNINREPNFLSFYWNNDKVDNHLLSSGLIHLNKKDALLHAKALRSFTSKEDE